MRLKTRFLNWTKNSTGPLFNNGKMLGLDLNRKMFPCLNQRKNFWRFSKTGNCETKKRKKKKTQLVMSLVMSISNYLS